MYALIPEHTRTLIGTGSRGKSFETVQAEPDDVPSASVQHGTARRMAGLAAACLFCRYRGPAVGKDATNA